MRIPEGKGTPSVPQGGTLKLRCEFAERNVGIENEHILWLELYPLLKLAHMIPTDEEAGMNVPQRRGNEHMTSDIRTRLARKAFHNEIGRLPVT